MKKETVEEINSLLKEGNRFLAKGDALSATDNYRKIKLIYNSKDDKDKLMYNKILEFYNNIKNAKNKKSDVNEKKKLGKPFNKKILVIIVIIAILVILIIIGFLAYVYFKNPEKQIGIGANIEQVVISEDFKMAYVRLSAGINSGNITGVKFTLKDASGKEYNYETSEGAREISIPYKTNWLSFFIKPKYTGTYDYVINTSEAGLDNFNKLNEVDVSFKYKTSLGQEVESPKLDTKKPTTPKPTPSGGGGGGGGGSSGGSSGGNNPPAGCTANCAGKQCGDDGCGGSCGVCNSSQNCINGTCVNNCINECQFEQNNLCNVSLSYNCTIVDGCLKIINNTDCSLDNKVCSSSGCSLAVQCTSNFNCTLKNSCGNQICNLASHQCQWNYNSSSTICRASSGLCDIAENCTGGSEICPDDFKKSNINICRASAGLCDIAEFCNGISNNCPNDIFNSSSTICRASSGLCDIAENCTGTGAICPSDVKQPNGNSCTGTDKCSLYSCQSGNCTGTAKDCSDGILCTIDSCDISTGSCLHNTDSCQCTSDSQCNDGNVCTIDSCDSNSCNHVPGNAGVLCRASSGICDSAEFCSGSSATCPTDLFNSSSTICRASIGECDITEKCTGSSSNCPANLFNATGTICSGNKFCNGTGDCVVCNINANCGANGFIGGLFCNGNNVYRNYTTFTCNSPGTLLSLCSSSNNGLLNQTCGTNSCDNFGNNYCKSGNIYHNQTCYSRGCSSGSCYTNPSINETLVQACTNECSNGSCVCIGDCTGKSCGDNGCGGSCGSCGDGQRCNASYVCEEYNASVSSEGWYSFARDSENSRIVDDNLIPPFRLKWQGQTHIDYNYIFDQTQAKLLYTNGTLYDVDAGGFWMIYYHYANSLWGIHAFNSDTGHLNWTKLVHIQDGPSIINNGYIVFGGQDGDQENAASIATNVLDGTIPKKAGTLEEVHGDYSINQDNSAVYVLTRTRADAEGADDFFRKIQSTYTPLTSYVNGNFGKALQFPNKYTIYSYGRWSYSDYLSIDQNMLKQKLQPGAHNTITNNLTLSFWVNLGDNNKNGNRVLLANGNYFSSAGEDQEYGSSLGFNCQPSVCTLQHNLFSYGYNGKETINNINFSTNQWHQVTFTYDHQNEKWYLDGQLKETIPKTQDLQLFNMIFDLPLYLGSDKTSNCLSGALDEFAMYNRALDGTEIMNIWNNTITPDSSTIILYHFDNNASKSENQGLVYDYSGNGNNASYDGHLNTGVVWEIQPNPAPGKFGKGNIGNSLGTFYSYNGQITIHSNIIYDPNQILTAYNSSDGSILWTKGNVLTITSNYVNNNSIGDTAFIHEIVYSNDIAYTLGLKKISNYTWEYILYGFNSTTGDELLDFDFNMNQSNSEPFIYLIPLQSGSLVVENNIAYVRLDSKILAINTVNKNILWQKNLAATGSSESWVQSLFISGNYIFVSVKEGFIVFDKTNGNEVWRFKNPGDFAVYERPSIIEADNKVFISITHNLDTKIYAFEQGYTNPQIINNKPYLPVVQVGNLYVQDIGPTYQYQHFYVNYSFNVLNGEYPYNWQIVSGRLPNGLYLINDSDNYNGYLYGTPTEIGDFNFNVRVTDSRGNSDEKSFNIRILPDSKVLSMDLQEGFNNYSGCEDSGIDGSSGRTNKNYGNLSFIQGDSGNGITEQYKERGLIKFRIFQREGGPVPDDAIIVNASLTFYKNDSYLHDVSGYKILRNWSEMEVTWNNVSKNETWFTPGANEIGEDRSEKLVNFTTQKCLLGTYQYPDIYCISIPSYYHFNSSSDFYTFDVSPLVQGYDSGEENYGWLFTQANQGALQIASCDNSNLSIRPKLSINYKRFNPDNIAPKVRLYINPSIVMSGTNSTIYANTQDDFSILNYTSLWNYYPYYFTSPSSNYPLNLSCSFSDDSKSLSCAGIKKMDCLSEAYYHCIQYGTNTTYLYFDSVDEYGLYSNVTKLVLVVNSFNSTTITTTMLRDGIINQAYSDYIYVEGNATQVNWSVSQGSLPSGLNLDFNSGMISGNPTSSGIYNFIIKVYNATDSYYQNLSISVYAENGGMSGSSLSTGNIIGSVVSGLKSSNGFGIIDLINWFRQIFGLEPIYIQ